MNIILEVNRENLFGFNYIIFAIWNLHSKKLKQIGFTLLNIDIGVEYAYPKVEYKNTKGGKI